jgi:hypothetical protein
MPVSKLGCMLRCATVAIGAKRDHAGGAIGNALDDSSSASESPTLGCSTKGKADDEPFVDPPRFGLSKAVETVSDDRSTFDAPTVGTAVDRRKKSRIPMVATIQLVDGRWSGASDPACRSGEAPTDGSRSGAELGPIGF